MAFDFLQYIPEEWREEYEAGAPSDPSKVITTVTKVLELLQLSLSGNAGPASNLDSRFYALKNFWDAYKTNDLGKLREILDADNISPRVAQINEICGSSTAEQSEKAYLMTISSFNKMKGTLKGVTSVLRMFGISLSVIPWYSPKFNVEGAPECSVLITAALDDGCLAEDSYRIIEEIIGLLLDVCAIVVEFSLIRKFVTFFTDYYEVLAVTNIGRKDCEFWEWRRSEVEHIAMPAKGVCAPIMVDQCQHNYKMNGVVLAKCDCQACRPERMDIILNDITVRVGANDTVVGYEWPVRYPITEKRFPIFGDRWLVGGEFDPNTRTHPTLSKLDSSLIVGYFDIGGTSTIGTPIAPTESTLLRFGDFYESADRLVAYMKETNEGMWYIHGEYPQDMDDTKQFFKTYHEHAYDSVKIYINGIRLHRLSLSKIGDDVIGGFDISGWKGWIDGIDLSYAAEYESEEDGTKFHIGFYSDGYTFMLLEPLEPDYTFFVDYIRTDYVGERAIVKDHVEQQYKRDYMDDYSEWNQQPLIT